MKYVVCLHLYIPWKSGERGSTPRGATGPSFLFVCPSRYDARHRKPRGFVYALNLGGTGISPPDSFIFRSSFRFRSRFHSRSSSSSSSTTSGDIFYCSGSRQLNHSSVALASSTPRIVLPKRDIKQNWSVYSQCLRCDFACISVTRSHCNERVYLYKMR